ncbi:CCA tRNA nucleotidyltransferase [Paludicola sp. MB14-C6]|uniref:CCA tRNA nucleotidyltransferase n=1 Tax=Paludihabitans sp. MB14-C6 TaxID=3070656 RepID=UPI0027DB66F1|nr:CCA tRNA nucleotidyltransferase [Paludicola sp. MB14-C6]WMJ24023.1 CCA tRNA nucleotidyltransferase [Paludicola sp. MB14-C6]
MKFSLPQQVNKALTMLHQNGFEAFIVGGCVRDFVLQQEPKDFDITTNATPQQTLSVFHEYKTIETGIQHGTVTVIIQSIPLEITTYRVDGEYTDYRRPDCVAFTKNLQDDLARRDFTINAIAYNENSGIQDYYSGQEDIKRKIIRCVGIPQKRFEEDALRIMRALRFSAVLGFTIEDTTKKAMFEKKELLHNIAVERIAVEIIKLICGENAKAVLSEYLAILAEVIPELLSIKGFDQHNPHHIYDVLTHSFVALENVPPIAHLRLAALFHDIGKPMAYTLDENSIGHFYGHPKMSEHIAVGILRRFKFDNDTIHKVSVLVNYHDASIEATEKSIKRWLYQITPELFLDLLELKCADNLAQNPKYRNQISIYQEIKGIYHKIIEDQDCFSMKDLKVNGNDLIHIGITNGKEIGMIKGSLLNLVIDGQLNNDKAELLEKAKQLKSTLS